MKFHLEMEIKTVCYCYTLLLVFVESGPFCGNGIVEGTEQCDCGLYKDCKDPCCIARGDPGYTDYCVLSANSQCRYCI